MSGMFYFHELPTERLMITQDAVKLHATEEFKTSRAGCLLKDDGWLKSDAA
jgi:hypothetical protein